MRKQFNIQEVKTKTQVDMVYREYQKFMQTSNMPSYIFRYVKQNGTTIAEERFENNKYNLIIADTLCTTYKDAAKGILFHEFTHIFDEEELVNVYGFSHDDRNTPYVYKEIHAEQIKTLYLLGCKNIDDLGGIDKDRGSFQHKKSLYDIHDYLIECQKELRENIDLIENARQSNTKIDVYEFNNILNRIFYYIGTSSIYLKYCDESAYDELDIKDVWNYYGYNMNVLLKAFTENELGYHTKELIEEIAQIRLSIVMYYGGKLKLVDDTTL